MMSDVVGQQNQDHLQMMRVPQMVDLRVVGVLVDSRPHRVVVEAAVRQAREVLKSQHP